MRVYRDGSKRERGNAINITIDEQGVEQVNQFCYFGSLISDDGTCTEEIKTRIDTAKNAFNIRRLLLSKRMRKDLKMKIILSYILQASEMWKWRNMERSARKIIIPTNMC